MWAASTESAYSSSHFSTIDFVPFATIYSSIRNTSDGICKRYFECTTFGRIVCLSEYLFRNNFIRAGEKLRWHSWQICKWYKVCECASLLTKWKYDEPGWLSFVDPMRGIMKTTCEIWNWCINWEKYGGDGTKQTGSSSRFQVIFQRGLRFKEFNN